MKITLVIPTYNEAENLPKLLQALFALPLPELNVLVVDDNSRDGTGQIAEDLKKTYKGKLDVMHRAGKLGLGSAYIQAFTRLLAGDSGAIGQMDADFSHEPAKVAELVEALKSCDMALGSRYVPGGSLDRDWPAWRKWLSTFGNFYARSILRLPIRDTTGGFRLWRRETLSAMPLERVRSNGYIFQVEMAYIAYKLGFHFKEIPIYFAERKFGQSKMSLRIQIEAALRVWGLQGQYRDLKPLKK
ncbi:MAG: polyprenol monophosphomannose synthase [Gammaproteobacteria bacterium]|nr:polyprenol monophosphomannose synthase [Gammaproteobacteria bacterium]